VYLRSRLKDLLGPVTRVKKEKKKKVTTFGATPAGGRGSRRNFHCIGHDTHFLLVRSGEDLVPGNAMALASIRLRVYEASSVLTVIGVPRFAPAASDRGRFGTTERCVNQVESVEGFFGFNCGCTGVTRSQETAFP